MPFLYVIRDVSRITFMKRRYDCLKPPDPSGWQTVSGILCSNLSCSEPHRCSSLIERGLWRKLWRYCAVRPFKAALHEKKTHSLYRPHWSPMLLTYSQRVPLGVSITLMPLSSSKPLSASASSHLPRFLAASR